MHLDSVDQKSSRDFVAESMFQKLGGDERLSEHLIPKYALGCRRMTPGSNYLQSLLSPNVEVIAQSAVEVTPTGLIDSTGNHTEVDVIVFATGFDTSFSPAYTVVGQNGRTLREEWQDFPKAYLSLMARNFPNMFRKSQQKPKLSDRLGLRSPTLLELTLIVLRFPWSQRSCISWIGASDPGMAYSLLIQSDFTYATNLHQITRAVR